MSEPSSYRREEGQAPASRGDRRHRNGPRLEREVVRALVIAGYGINCEEEMAAGYRLAGAEPRIVHLNEILAGKVSIHEFDVLNLPGGFSFGDDLGSGKALAIRMRYRRIPSGGSLFDEIRSFVAAGKLVLGICNGFQALVKMGLLPDIDGRGEQEVTLTTNLSGKFEDRWCWCRVPPGSRTPFLTGIELIRLPVRHAEGRLVIGSDETRRRIQKLGLCCLEYCDKKGNPAEAYPANPNGSELSCAGLTDRSGRILGMMPHPESYLSLYNDPDWPRIRRLEPERSEEGAGLTLFRNAVNYIRSCRKVGESDSKGQDTESRSG